MAVNTGPRTFDSIHIGDELPTYTILETQETINAARFSVEGEELNPRSIHTDPEFAKSGLFGGTVNAGPTTMAYVARMLERWFPAGAFYNGGRQSLKAIEPIRAGDTVVFTGKVTAKRDEGGKKLVDCEIKGVNQLGKLIGVAEATLAVEK